MSFMWSYPNLIPLDEATVLEIAGRVEPYRFDRVYGGWWGRVVVRDGAGAVRRSADRYVARLRERPVATLPGRAAVSWPRADSTVTRLASAGCCSSQDLANGQ